MKKKALASLRARAMERLAAVGFQDAQVTKDSLPDCCRSLMQDIELYLAEVETQYHELRLTQDQLLESRDRYLRLFEAAPVGYLLVDQRGIITDANSSAVELFGRAKQFVLGCPLARFIHDEDLERFLGHRRGLESGTARGECEVRLKRPDGGVRCVQVSSQTIHETIFAVGTMLIVLADVTRLKETEERLLEAEQQLSYRNRLVTVELDLTARRLELESAVRKHTETTLVETAHQYELVVENSSEGIVVVQDERLLFANRQVIEWTGMPLSELATMTLGQFIHPEDREMVLAHHRARLHGGEKPEPYDCRIIDSREEVRWLRVQSVVVTWEGRPAEVAFVSDVTERKKMEVWLEQERRFLRQILDHVPVMITVFSLEQGMILTNPAFEKLLGWRTEDIMEGHLMELLYPDPKVRRDATTHAKSVTGEWRDFPMTSKQGGTVVAAWSNVELGDGLRMGIGVDISQRKRSELALHEAYDQLSAEREALKRKNIAMREVIAHYDINRRRIEETIAVNIEKAVLPMLQKIQRDSMGRTKKYAELIERELHKISSPLVPALRLKFDNLTAREQEVCRLIGRGMSTKEVAGALGLSTSTVQKYRELIRRKLKLTGSQTNLDVYLRSLAEE